MEDAPCGWEGSPAENNARVPDSRFPRPARTDGDAAERRTSRVSGTASAAEPAAAAWFRALGTPAWRRAADAAVGQAPVHACRRLARGSPARAGSDRQPGHLGGRVGIARPRA